MLTKELKNWRVTANKKELKFSCYFIDVTVVIKLLLLQFMQHSDLRTLRKVDWVEFMFKERLKNQKGDFLRLLNVPSIKSFTVIVLSLLVGL